MTAWDHMPVGDDMLRYRLKQKQYWSMVSFIVLAKCALAYALASNLASFDTLKSIDTALWVSLAMIVGGRFADSGLRRWVGWALVLIVSLLLPIALLLVSDLVAGPSVAPPKSGDASTLAELLPMVVNLVPLICLLALVIWTGIRPSAPMASANLPQSAA
jgi:hypothetical protein